MQVNKKDKEKDKEKKCSVYLCPGITTFIYQKIYDKKNDLGIENGMYQNVFFLRLQK